MTDYVSRQYLLNEYDRQHQGPPGGARKIIAGAPAADVVPVNREKLIAVLRDYFSIGDSYTYELTRAKSAFDIGTVSVNDFEEWGEEDISCLCDYIFRELRKESEHG